MIGRCLPAPFFYVTKSDALSQDKIWLVYYALNYSKIATSFFFVYTDTPTNSSSGVSSMHSISELTITVENSPTTSLTSRGSAISSRSSTLGIIIVLTY